MVTLFASTAPVNESSGGFTWFDDFHVIPRLFSFGTLTIALSPAVEVFNAFRLTPKSWTSYDDKGVNGSSLETVPVFPFSVDPMAARVMVLDVTERGDPAVDITLDFGFSGVSSTLVKIPLTIERFVVWGLEPEFPYQEQLVFLSDIHPSQNGNEQRITLVQVPDQSWSYQFIIEEGLEAQQFQNLLFDFQSRYFAVPVRNEESKLTSAAVVGALTINVNATGFRDYRVGGHAIIFTSQTVNDVLEIASFTATTIVFTTALTNAYVFGTQVFPNAFCKIQSDVSGSFFTVGLRTKSIRFVNTDNDVDFTDLSPFSTFNSKLLLDLDQSMLSGNIVTSKRQSLVTAQGAGLRFSEGLWDRNKPIRRLIIRADGLQAIRELRGLVYALKGRVTSFYVPSFTEDLTATSDLTIATNILDVTNVGYTEFVRQRLPINAIRVVFKDGSTPVLKTVLSSSVTSSSVERLLVDSNWVATIPTASILRIEYLHKVRLASNIVNFNFEDSGTRAQLSAGILGVFE